MIQKIQSDKYLKRYDNMDVGERHVLKKRVEEWLQNAGKLLAERANEPEAQLQNAIQCSAWWNDSECAGWDEGARMLTAFTGVADTWLPDKLYTKAARRAIRKMTEVLTSVIRGTHQRAQVTGCASIMEIPAVERHCIQSTAATALYAGGGRALPVRPKHIDQYVHVLPKSTQERAAAVQGLLRELDRARENARLLMGREDSKADDIARWARMGTKIDAQIKAIYRELDEEWEKAVKAGRVTVDDLGNAHIVELQDAVEEKSLFSPEEQEVDENLRKAQSLRKWLIDLRYGVKDEKKMKKHSDKWKKRYKEMVQLGGMETVTKKVREAAEYYGIEIEKIKL